LTTSIGKKLTFSDYTNDMTTAQFMLSSCNVCVKQFFWAIAIRAFDLDSCIAIRAFDLDSCIATQSNIGFKKWPQMTWLNILLNIFRKTGSHSLIGNFKFYLILFSSIHQRCTFVEDLKTFVTSKFGQTMW
jgi:hypothetical protein